MLLGGLFTGGRIIFFSSTLTAFSLAPPTSLLYVATKASVEQLARVLAKELGPKGITVNTVSPCVSLAPPSAFYTPCSDTDLGPLDGASQWADRHRTV